MNEHTPGPWHCGGIFEPDSDRPTSNVWGPTPPGMQSGNIVCSNATIPDARLIAAAPDLLRELLQVRDAIIGPSIDRTARDRLVTVGQRMELSLDRINTALAKAGL